MLARSLSIIHRVPPVAAIQNCRKKHSVCVVGSGPAGFYVTQHLISKGPADLTVDVLERLPVPFGLVRFGVAPDHPEVKNVESTFSKVASSSRVSFLGNVSVGDDGDVSLEKLREMYDAVVLAYGAAKDKILGIPGEKSPNVLSARSFVGFYNGLPDEMGLKIDLSHEVAAVVGLGNVALDVARVLLTPVDVLRKTDITEAALDLLSNSKVKHVHIIGRRGPLHVAFTIKELREMISLCKPCFDRNDFEGVKVIVPKLQRPRKRLTELMAKTALDPPTEKQKELWKTNDNTWTLKLLRTPEEILSRDGATVSGIKLGINRLVGENLSEDQHVESTGEHEVLDCGLVLRSIGYQSVRVDKAIPFDERRGVVPNVNGRVLKEPDSECLETGLYCVGWLATGPRGVIVDTMVEAFKVGEAILSDVAEKRLSTGKDGTRALKEVLKRDVIQFSDWEKIDQREKSEGKKRGKPREKLTTIQDLVRGKT